MTDAEQRRAIVNALAVEISEHVRAMNYTGRRRDLAAEEFFHGALALAQFLGDIPLAERILDSSVMLDIKWQRVRDLA